MPNNEKTGKAWKFSNITNTGFIWIFARNAGAGCITGKGCRVMIIQFTVPGEPKGKGRPRFTNAGGFAKTYTPPETAGYENLVKLCYREKYGGMAFDEKAELDIKVTAFFSIPKSTSKKKREKMQDGDVRPTKKPDLDNILKIVADALNGIAYHDDSQIVYAEIAKYYDENPRVEVEMCSYWR